MRRPLLVAVLCLAATLVTASPGSAAQPIKATFVGDSVAASIGYTATARAQLRRGLSVQLDLAVCRRLVLPSCAFGGTTPATGLEAVQGFGRSLGEVLIVMVGHNESAVGYGEGIDSVLRAALRQGARAVVWLTLRETRDLYHATNVAIRQADKRWPQLTVADWNAYSRGKSWFAGDGVHLTTAGAEALATFLRHNVFDAMCHAVRRK
jgi:hypothetical protein